MSDDAQEQNPQLHNALVGRQSVLQWLTLKEASEFLGVHFTTLRKWADEGEIRVFRTPGGHRRFSVADLRRFLEERVRHEVAPGPAVSRLDRHRQLVVAELGEALERCPAVALLLEELEGVEVHAGMVDAPPGGVGEGASEC